MNTIMSVINLLLKELAHADLAENDFWHVLGTISFSFSSINFCTGPFEIRQFKTKNVCSTPFYF